MFQIILIFDDFWYLWALPIKLKTLHQNFIIVSFIRCKNTFVKVPRSFSSCSNMWVLWWRSWFYDQVIEIRCWNNFFSHCDVINEVIQWNIYFFQFKFVMCFNIVLKSNWVGLFTIFDNIKIVLNFDRWDHSSKNKICSLSMH